MARIMGIDYGTKRVGLAVTDPLQIIATALTTVATEEIFTFLAEYVKQEAVELFVVGKPLHLDGRETDATKPTEKFVVALQKKFPDIPIDREDEAFTSKMAAKTLVASGVKKKKRRKKGMLDKVSATIILQSYLGHNIY